MRKLWNIDDYVNSLITEDMLPISEDYALSLIDAFLVHHVSSGGKSRQNGRLAISIKGGPVLKMGWARFHLCSNPNRFTVTSKTVNNSPFSKQQKIR